MDQPMTNACGRKKRRRNLYQESDLVIRNVAGCLYSRALTKIICDSEGIVRKIKDFPLYRDVTRKGQNLLYDGKVPLFHKYKIEDENRKNTVRR